MRGKARSQLPVLVVIGAIAACAVAPGIAGGQGKVAGHGKIGVKGATASNFVEGPAAASGPARPAPRSDRGSGLEARVGSLPFTGWDLIILGGVAMVLSGTGFMLHRLSTPRAPYS